jgi:hypothetical protein
MSGETVVLSGSQRAPATSGEAAITDARSPSVAVKTPAGDRREP